LVVVRTRVCVQTFRSARIRAPLDRFGQVKRPCVSYCRNDECGGQASNRYDCAGIEQFDASKTPDGDRCASGRLDRACHEQQPQLGWPDPEERHPENTRGVRREIRLCRHEQIGGNQNDGEERAHET
jgi:hypothetical protein